MSKSLVPQHSAAFKIVLAATSWQAAQCTVPDARSARYVDAYVVTGDVPNVTERSCGEVRASLIARGVAPVDGRYMIDPDGIGGREVPFVVYCDRMDSEAGSPREFLEVDAENNFRVGYLDGLLNAPCQCQWFKRSFSRVRLLISAAPVRYAIDGLDTSHGARTVGPQIPGRPPTCPRDGLFPPDYRLVCTWLGANGVTPNSPTGNELGSVEGCGDNRPFGDGSSTRMLLAGTGFRISREDLSKWVPSAQNPDSTITNQVLLSTNAGLGFEVQLTSTNPTDCVRISPPRYEPNTHAVIEIERDLPPRAPLGEDCATPWLLDEGWLGGTALSMNASASSLCRGNAFNRNVRYYEVRVPGNSSRVITAQPYNPAVDIFVRVLDRCGASDCVLDTMDQQAGTHTLTVRNADPAPRSFIVTVSGRANTGDTFYRITAGPPGPA